MLEFAAGSPVPDQGPSPATGRPALAVSVSGDRALPVVVVVGEVDIATVGRLRAELGRVLAQGARSIVLDVGSMTFCDASGLGTLAGTAGHLQGRSGRLVLREPGVFLRRLLDIIGPNPGLEFEVTSTGDAR